MKHCYKEEKEEKENDSSPIQGYWIHIMWEGDGDLTKIYNVAGSLIWSILAICNHTNWFFV